MNDRTALANVEAEAALLGALMMENALIDRAADIVQPADFAEPVHGRIYSLLIRERSLGRHANPVTLPPFLQDDPAIEALGGTGYLAQLTGSGASMLGAMDFARQIRDLAKRRRLVEGLDAAIGLASDLSATTEQIVDTADAAIVDAGATTDTMHQPSGADCIREMIDSMDDPASGILCNAIPSLDGLWGKLREKQLVIVAGRPGMGKSAMALSYAVGVARGGHGVLFVSLEMSSQELGGRLAADMCFNGRGGVPYAAISNRNLTPDQRRMVARAHGEMSGLPMQVIDTGRITIGRLGMMIRRHKRRMAAHGVELKLVIVDYLQLVSADTKGRSQYEAVSEVSRGLKAIAKDNDVVMMALAQLSREAEKRPDKRPLLSDLRDSGQIEQDADVAMFLFRQEYYLRKEQPEEGSAEWPAWRAALDACQNRIDFIVAKNRQGQEGIATGEFWGANQAVRG
ncbi:replicative DNA helicase [Sphingomonas laterariae]|uniref:DNA 5'-3' helicase n=1 Tax=Edaphosphingomonas laterariae TaxID=861865 RepID=A0A239JIT1_9SPHN|nr:DnaB-like helicase C-terminal domain-containing protein [Sphingomonas laterariae]SNT05740.1 replicative DNA helicase [Sphingomonas laterariae]